MEIRNLVKHGQEIFKGNLYYPPQIKKTGEFKKSDYCKRPTGKELLKEELDKFYTSEPVYRYYCIWEMFCGSRGGCAKSAKLSLESVLVGAEDHKFENKKRTGSVELDRSNVTRPL